MSIDKDKLKNFVNSEEVCDENGTCYIKTNDGLIETKKINKKIITEDGRQLLKEELPVSNSNNRFLI